MIVRSLDEYTYEVGQTAELSGIIHLQEHFLPGFPSY